MSDDLTKDLFLRAASAGISMEELAHGSGMNRATFVRWRKGENCDLDMLARANKGLDAIIAAKTSALIDQISDRVTSLQGNRNTNSPTNQG